MSQAPGTFGEFGAGSTEGGGQRLEAVSDAPGLVAPGGLLSSLQDVSGNELQALPAELCSLPALRDLSVRRNQLSTLPDGEEKNWREEGWRAGTRVCESVYVYTGEVPKTLHRTSLSEVPRLLQCIRQTKLFVLDQHPSEAGKAWVISSVLTNEEQGTERRVGKCVGTL